MRWLHSSGGIRAQTAQCVRSIASVGGELGPSDACSNKDAGERERETPTPSENEQAARREEETVRDNRAQNEIINTSATDHTVHSTTSSSSETVHSQGTVGTQFENHIEHGTNSRDSERQQPGRRRGTAGCFPGASLGALDSWPDGAHKTPAISTLSSINGVMPTRSSYHSGNDRFFF